MRRLIIYTLVMTMMCLVSCEMPEYEVRCFPQRITTNVNAGTSSYTVTADYKYDGERVDYIILSIGQTHYFSYNEDGQVTHVRKVDVKTRQKEELRLQYDGNQLTKVDIYVMNLDMLTHDDLDTTNTRYHDYTYSGRYISKEEVYARDKDAGRFEKVTENHFTFDGNGNITEYTTTDVRSGNTQTYAFEYDGQKNPFHELSMYFTGESYVNNMTEKKDVGSNTTFTYQIIYNEDKYPEQVIEKDNGVISRVMRFTYFCK